MLIWLVKFQPSLSLSLTHTTPRLTRTHTFSDLDLSHAQNTRTIPYLFLSVLFLPYIKVMRDQLKKFQHRFLRLTGRDQLEKLKMTMCMI